MTAASIRSPGHPRALALYLGADRGLALRLRASLQGVGGDLLALPPSHPMPAEARGAVAVALLDARGPLGGDLPDAIASVRAQLGPGARILCLAQSGTLELRLEVLRAGADALLPLAPVATDHEAVAARVAELLGGSAPRPRILVVDDQAVAALFATRVLEKAGMAARAVGDPLRVLDELVAYQPDLVLMDLHMPGASGAELTRLIRDHEELYATPIVFLSGERDPAMQLEALRVGGDDFLSKPVAPERLIAVVEERLRRSRDRPGLVASAGRLSGLMDRRAFLRRLDRQIAETDSPDPGQGLFLVALHEPSPGRARTSGAIGPIDAEPAVVQAGARLPMQILGALAACLGPADRLAVLGEGRFGVLARRDDREQLLALGERLGDAAGAVAEVGIGLAPLDVPADDALTLLSRAEAALAGAHRDGGRRLGLLAPAMPAHGSALHHAQLVRQIEQALAGDGLQLFFQPIVALHQTCAAIYDVSLRLRSAGGEYVPAFDFLPAARSAGLTASLDRWVLDQALAALQRERVRHEGLRFLIEQGVARLLVPDWLAYLRDQINARDLIRQRPLLRIPYVELAMHADAAEPCLDNLRRLGIGVCLDHPDETAPAQVLIERLRPAMVRIGCRRALALGTPGLRALVERLHAAGAAVMVADIEDPVAISQVWPTGVDLIQGRFVQPPASELGFDFAETVVG